MAKQFVRWIPRGARKMSFTAVAGARGCGKIHAWHQLREERERRWQKLLGFALYVHQTTGRPFDEVMAELTK